MSAGSITAAATPGNAARTTSPAASWDVHCSALVMNIDGRRNVHATPDERTASSERMWYAATALLMSPDGTAALDSSATRPTPARLISASRPGMSA
jgi:hypothetical protein